MPGHTKARRSRNVAFKSHASHAEETTPSKPASAAKLARCSTRSRDVRHPCSLRSRGFALVSSVIPSSFNAHPVLPRTAASSVGRSCACTVRNAAPRSATRAVALSRYSQYRTVSHPQRRKPRTKRACGQVPRHPPSGAQGRSCRQRWGSPAAARNHTPAPRPACRAPQSACAPLLVPPS